MTRYVLALDQGTTSSRAILFDEQGRPCGMEQQELTQIYPRPGWVEQAPEEIWASQIGTAARLLRTKGAAAEQVAAIGIANQRETTLLWERETGRPVANAIVWQDRRTAEACARLKSTGAEDLTRSLTGLPVDPYFSATKIGWLLHNTPGLRRRAESGEIAFGTVDTYLLWRLTGGKEHATDESNASRTLLYDIAARDWNEDLLNLFGVPAAILPEVRPTTARFGTAQPDLLGAAIPICALAGDQQAALFGQACVRPGMAKNTYGTGCFLLLNTGRDRVSSSQGLITTVAWNLAGKLAYALEGSVFTAGAAIQWLRDELQILHSAAEVEPLAASVPDSAGIWFVPAFTGLGAPYWEPEARGALLGITRGSSRAHVARAALEAVCHQTCDVLDAMVKDFGVEIPELRVDGGMARNDLLLQMQADLLGVPLARPEIAEITAVGAAYLAGIGCGMWSGVDEIESRWRVAARYEPRMGEAERLERRDGWRRAVQRVR